MKIFHEAPISILKEIQNYTDGEYILPHLLDKYPTYLEYMKEAKAKGRYIIMDNSLHELGKAYDEDRLLYWIDVFEPDEFIVPDVWENSSKTVVNAYNWKHKKLKAKKLVAVVQGESEVNALMCFKELKDIGYKKIAISYGASWYLKNNTNPNKDLAKAKGRYNFINLANSLGYTKDVEVHLLGTCYPNEFIWYRDFDFAKSLDTSNPVMAGIENQHYMRYGLLKKPTTKIDEVIDKQIDNSMLNTIIHNIIDFKWINGFMDHKVLNNAKFFIPSQRFK